ncbi:MarR family transcriptional regulator [Sphaerisporangium sp. NPDC005288]|uniref:MarR family winged helix-turn-helix transcriptional regulator n=1 Tax=Sphaerisporangium sp. NPDC005288 TaxID=3155114 RepID=UPI0033BF16B5
MASDGDRGELLVRLAELVPVIKAVKRDLPFPGPRAGLSLLVVLYRCGAMRLGELADCSEVDQSVISRHVADVEERGWVERAPNPRDGRSWYVRLTPDGERVVREALAHARHSIEGALDGWTDEDVAELSGLLGRFRAGFDAHRDRPLHRDRPPQPMPDTAPVPDTARAQTVKGLR